MELEWLVDEFRGMRFGNAPPSVHINPGPEDEEGDGDVWMESSNGFEDGVWDGDDGWPSTP